MRNTIKLFVLIAVIVLGSLSVANAQVAPQSAIKANVPFSFVVNGKTFKAGIYAFGRLDTSGGSDTSQLVMRGAHGETAIFDTIQKSSTDTVSDTHLVFEKVAGQYVLIQIWGKGDTEGSELTRSGAEVKAIAAAAGGSNGEATSGVDSN
jgi:hypothetical protein